MTEPVRREQRLQHPDSVEVRPHHPYYLTWLMIPWAIGLAWLICAIWLVFLIVASLSLGIGFHLLQIPAILLGGMLVQIACNAAHAHFTRLYSDLAQADTGERPDESRPS